MNSKLEQKQNWPELAQQANWSANALAKSCDVSERTLRRHFLKTMGKNLRQWLTESRQNRAIELLQNGSAVKLTAITLGYKHSSNFSRKYKKHWGKAPLRIHKSHP